MSSYIHRPAKTPDDIAAWTAILLLTHDIKKMTNNGCGGITFIADPIRVPPVNLMDYSSDVMKSILINSFKEKDITEERRQELVIHLNRFIALSEFANDSSSNFEFDFKKKLYMICMKYGIDDKNDIKTIYDRYKRILLTDPNNVISAVDKNIITFCKAVRSDIIWDVGILHYILKECKI